MNKKITLILYLSLIIKTSVFAQTPNLFTNGSLTEESKNLSGKPIITNETPSCIVNIPDTNFKSYLVGNSTINTNGDTEIQCSEAQAFNGTINCASMGISDMSGLENFTGITELYCYSNQLNQLDVSSNTALTTLYCNSNQLTQLDVSNNSALTTLSCGNNQLTGLNLMSNLNLINLYCDNNLLSYLDVSQTVLEDLDCSFNNLTTLDISDNASLTELRCSSNQLTSLNVANGNNTNFTSFIAANNPNLTCIEVDDAAWSDANWIATATFSEDCSGTLGTNKLDKIVTNVYPNPVQSQLNLELKEAVNLSILNPLGETVATQKAKIGYNTIDMSHLNSGVYFLQVGVNGILKIMKE